MAKTTLKLIGENNFFVQEAYKVLRTNLQFCGSDVHVVSVTSCNENEGKTAISLSLAKSLAELGKRVLVIDADMRKSVIAGRNTDATNVVGLSEILVGQKQVTECLYHTQYEGLDLIFSGSYPPNPVELLNSKPFSILLEESKKIYDYVIVDTPPLSRVIDAAVIAPLCDGTILLIGDGVRIRSAQEVVSQLKMSGGKILGVVRNDNGKPRKKSRKEKYGYYQK